MEMVGGKHIPKQLIKLQLNSIYGRQGNRDLSSNFLWTMYKLFCKSNNIKPSHYSSLERWRMLC